MIEIRCDKCGKEIKTLDISKRARYSAGGFKLIECLEIDLDESVEVLRDGKILCAECDKQLERVMQEAKRKFLEENER